MITLPPDHAMWKKKSVDDAFDLFEQNFPQLDIRACISHQNMQNFVEASPVTFPMISRPASLIATIGKPETGGVVVLGDAAHCFPPNLGLGLNSAFEDVSVLMRVIDEAIAEAVIPDIVKRYEQLRDDDIFALMKIVRNVGPYVSSDMRLRSNLWRFFLVPARLKLIKTFPRVLYPSVTALTRTDMAFSEVWRLGNVSTFRIYVGLSSIFGVPLAAFILYSLLSSTVT